MILLCYSLRADFCTRQMAQVHLCFVCKMCSLRARAQVHDVNSGAHVLFVVSGGCQQESGGGGGWCCAGGVVCCRIC